MGINSPRTSRPITSIPPLLHETTPFTPPHSHARETPVSVSRAAKPQPLWDYGRSRCDHFTGLFFRLREPRLSVHLSRRRSNREKSLCACTYVVLEKHVSRGPGSRDCGVCSRRARIMACDLTCCLLTHLPSIHTY